MMSKTVLLPEIDATWLGTSRGRRASDSEKQLGRSDDAASTDIEAAPVSLVFMQEPIRPRVYPGL